MMNWQPITLLAIVIDLLNVIFTKEALLPLSILVRLEVSQSILTAGMQADIENFAFHYKGNGIYEFNRWCQ